MPGRNLAFLSALIFFSVPVLSADLDHPVSGDVIEDVLGTMKTPANSPYIIEGESNLNVENSKADGEDYIFNHSVKEVSGNISDKKKFEDFGYTMPGTFEKQESYVELDKLKMAKDFRKVSTGGINLTFIRNDFDYQSTNDIINKTIGSGSQSVKGGALYIRHDSYMSKALLLNTHWSLGGGIGYNSGRGFFIDGSRSETVFNLWEFPIDAGIGFEIPVFNIIKLAATGGPSFMTLLQNRSDFQRGEEGKRKFQFSHGYFANAQFKLNLAGFGGETAYDLFTESQITNLFLNLEIRHQNYENFQDEIKVSGTSFGLGFTFEYL